MSDSILRVTPGVAAILHDAHNRIMSLPQLDHYWLYDHVRCVMAGITSVDAYYVGFYHGSTKIRLPYCYDGEAYHTPGTHTFAPNSPTAWMFREQRTYRYSMDNGRLIHSGLSFGKVEKRSADAVMVPLFRQPGERQGLFGVLSMHSYTPSVYDDPVVEAFEWMANVLSRALNRDKENEAAVAQLPGHHDRHDPNPLTVEQVAEHVVIRIDELRGCLEKIKNDLLGGASGIAEQIESVGHDCGRLQAELTEMLLHVDDGPTRRFQSLTEREGAVAMLLADALSNQEIAEALGVSVDTVKTHLGKIREKYGMADRTKISEDVRRHLGSFDA